MNLWKRISYLGVTSDLDFRLTRRIVLANRFGLLIAIITLIFMGVFLLRPHASIIPFIGMLVVAFSIWFLNAMDLTKLSRFITCLIPAVGLLVLNLSQKFGTDISIDVLHYATPRMIIIGSAALPFTMFAASEKKIMWVAVTIILLMGLGFDFIHTALGVDTEALGIKNDFYGIIFEDSVVLTVIILASSGFMFSIGDQYDIRAQKLLDDALHQTETLKRNEEAIKRTIDELETARMKEEERSWIAKGVAEIGGLLQGTSAGDDIYERWLSRLIKYLELNQGGLFISETDEETKRTQLRLVASYAYDRKKFQTKVLDADQGLIGQAYLEGERIYLKQVPENYVHITSGLGDATPRVIILVPLKTNQSTEGVLELASFKEMPSHYFELLDKLAESLAAYITNHKVTEQTRILLDQARTMGEELRANEEEMRQNLEELTATQEAMARKEREYLDRIAELEEAVQAKKILIKRS